MKKLILPILLFMMFMPFKVNAFTCDIKTIPTSSGYGLIYEFKKIDISTNESLKNAEFTLSFLNNNYIFETIQNYDDTSSYYEIKSFSNVNTVELYNLLPQSIKDLYDYINSYNDYTIIRSDINYTNNNSICTQWIDENNNTYWDSSIVIDFLIPLKIVEKRAPVGYKRDEMIVLANVSLIFNYKDRDENIDNKQIIITSTGNTFYKYDKSINYEQYIVNNNLSELMQNYPSYDKFIPNEKGSIELKIDNKIENTYKYETKSNNRVNYKIIFSNDGTASSGNNEIKIVIPEELEVIEDTISDNGILNSEKNEIYWNIDYIDSNSKKELSFDIFIPTRAKGEYKLYSSIHNGEIDVNARETTLKINEELSVPDTLKNPNTGTGISLIIITIILFVSSIANIMIKKKKNYILK